MQSWRVWAYLKWAPSSEGVSRPRSSALPPFVVTDMEQWKVWIAAGVVFDETHFGRFTNQYLAGTYLFDMCVDCLVAFVVSGCVSAQC